MKKLSAVIGVLTFMLMMLAVAPPAFAGIPYVDTMTYSNGVRGLSNNITASYKATVNIASNSLLARINQGVGGGLTNTQANVTFTGPFMINQADADSGMAYDGVLTWTFAPNSMLQGASISGNAATATHATSADSANSAGSATLAYTVDPAVRAIWLVDGTNTAVAIVGNYSNIAALNLSNTASNLNESIITVSNLLALISSTNASGVTTFGGRAGIVTFAASDFFDAYGFHPQPTNGNTTKWAGLDTNGTVGITADLATRGWPTTWAQADITGLIASLAGKQNSNGNLTLWSGMSTSGVVGIRVSSAAAATMATNATTADVATVALLATGVSSGITNWVNTNIFYAISNLNFTLRAVIVSTNNLLVTQIATAAGDAVTTANAYTDAAVAGLGSGSGGPIITNAQLRSLQGDTLLAGTNNGVYLSASRASNSAPVRLLAIGTNADDTVFVPEGWSQVSQLEAINVNVTGALTGSGAALSGVQGTATNLASGLSGTNMTLRNPKITFSGAITKTYTNLQGMLGGNPANWNGTNSLLELVSGVGNLDPSLTFYGYYRKHIDDVNYGYYDELYNPYHTTVTIGGVTTYASEMQTSMSGGYAFTTGYGIPAGSTNYQRLHRAWQWGIGGYGQSYIYNQAGMIPHSTSETNLYDSMYPHFWRCYVYTNDSNRVQAGSLDPDFYKMPCMQFSAFNTNGTGALTWWDNLSYVVSPTGYYDYASATPRVRMLFGPDGGLWVNGTITGNGSGLTNLNGAAITDGTISSNALDTATAAQLALVGTGGVVAAGTNVTVQTNGAVYTVNAGGGLDEAAVNALIAANTNAITKNGTNTFTGTTNTFSNGLLVVSTNIWGGPGIAFLEQPGAGIYRPSASTIGIIPQVGYNGYYNFSTTEFLSVNNARTRGRFSLGSGAATTFISCPASGEMLLETNVTVRGTLTASAYATATNSWSLNTPLPYGTNSLLLVSGAATGGIAGFTSFPTTTAGFLELAVKATGNITFTNPFGIYTSDNAYTRTLTNGTLTEIAVKIVPGQYTNMVIGRSLLQTPPS